MTVCKPASAVMSRPVEWFWRPFIPRGKITIIAGEGETGKSWMTLWMASCWSRGESFPIGTAIPNGNLKCMILNVEDDPDDTIVPRLDIMKARKENIIILADDDDDAEGWDLDERGMLRLDEIVEEHSPALLVLDALGAWFGQGSDIYRPNDVRAFMKALKRIARKRNVAIVLVAHLSKGQRSSTAKAILGSIEFFNAARSVLAVKRRSREKCLVSQIKGSVVAESEKIPTMEYTISDDGFEWLGETDLHVDDLTEAEADGVAGKGGIGDIKSVEDWLSSVLSEGPVESKVLFREASADGIARRTLERAKKSLGCSSWKEGRRWVVGLREVSRD